MSCFSHSHIPSLPSQLPWPGKLSFQFPSRSSETHFELPTNDDRDRFNHPVRSGEWAFRSTNWVEGREGFYPELLDPEIDQNDESERRRNVKKSRALMWEVKDDSLSGETPWVLSTIRMWEFIQPYYLHRINRIMILPIALWRFLGDHSTIGKMLKFTSHLCKRSRRHQVNI